MKTELRETLAHGGTISREELLARLEDRVLVILNEEALESLLANLVICLQSLLEINSSIVTANGPSASLAGGLKSVTGLANEICGDCVPHSYAPALKESMDQIQELARKIA